MTEWISRKEHYPEHGQYVWVWNGINRHIAVFNMWDEVRIFTIAWPATEGPEITHWMPLPNPPEEV